MTTSGTSEQRPSDGLQPADGRDPQRSLPPAGKAQPSTATPAFSVPTHDPEKRPRSASTGHRISSDSAPDTGRGRYPDSVHSRPDLETPGPEPGLADHISVGEHAITHQTSHIPTIPDEVYDRFPPHRKLIMVALLSFWYVTANVNTAALVCPLPLCPRPSLPFLFSSS
ncbi:hypothetical protein VTG60DRAFT_246 [Thermothelomyces hinnuleus]